MSSDLLDEDSDQSNYEVKVGDCITSPSSSYRVKKILGSGAYGKVTLCQKAGNNQMVALKVLTDLHDDHVGQQEARILQMLQEGDSGHDHIVRYIDSFQYEGHHCHEFEKLDIDMDDFLESRPDMTLQLRQIRPIIAQMARALQFLKTKGIVHCDLKPANIMMTDHIQQPLHIKLIDFGLACPVEEAKRGTLVQTFYYRAPEVQVGGAITEAIDIWSVGCIAAEMFLGKYLFSGIDQYDLMRHVVRIVGQPPQHVLDSGKHTRAFFRRPKGTSQWVYRQRLRRRPYPLTIASLDDIYENDPFNGEKMTSPAENQDRRLFVDLLKHMLDLDPVSRYTPEDILNHPFITMSHLQHCFPLYYSKCQNIMDQVLGSSNESTSSSTTQVSEAAEATQSQKPSHKSREVEKEVPQKRVKTDDNFKEGSKALQNGSRGETDFSLLGERESLEKLRQMNESEEEELSTSGSPTQISEGADATVETEGQKSSRKRRREEEEETPQKRLKKEGDASAKSQRGDDTSEEGPKEEDTAPQNRSRGETSFSPLRKEERPSSKRRESDEGEGRNPPLPPLRRSDEDSDATVATQGEKPSRKRRRGRRKKDDASGKSCSGGYKAI